MNEWFEMFTVIVHYFGIFLILNTALHIICRLTVGRSNSVKYLTGKCALITGGSSGIGFQVALILASRGCRVIIADVVNAEQAKNEIIRRTENHNIVAKYFNLASFKSIRSFAKDIYESEDRLDILIHNAGIGYDTDELTEDDLHPMLQINYFGPFLLTHLLTDLLKKSAPSRIIFTSSLLAFVNKLTMKTFNNPNNVMKGTSGLRSFLIYANTKASLVIASNEFASRLRKWGVTSNSLHPGVSRTEIYKPGLQNCIVKFIFYIWSRTVSKSTWESAQTCIHLATSEEVEGLTGKYFLDCKEFYSPGVTGCTVFCKQLYEASEEIVGLKEFEKI